MNHRQVKITHTHTHTQKSHSSLHQKSRALSSQAANVKAKTKFKSPGSGSELSRSQRPLPAIIRAECGENKAMNQRPPFSVEVPRPLVAHSDEFIWPSH